MNYINGGKIELTSGEKILVLLDPNNFKRTFLGYKIDELGEIRYYNLPIELFNYLDQINTVEYMPHFDWDRFKRKLQRVAYKGTLFIVTTTFLLSAGNLILEHTTPYNGQTIINYAIEKLNNAFQYHTGMNNSIILDSKEIPPEKIVLRDKIISQIEEKAKNSPYIKDYENYVIPYVETIIKTFPNMDMPNLSNLSNLNIEEISKADYLKMINSSRRVGAYYRPSTNTIYIPSDEVVAGDYEQKREKALHEINHANQQSILSNMLGYCFGGSLAEGTCQLMTADVFGFDDGNSTYTVSQSAVRVIQEIVGPEVIAQYNFTMNTDLIVKGLAKVYGNELDACKFISSLDNYCFYVEKEKYNNNINYRKMIEEVQDQLLVYETAKVKSDIQNGVYNSDVSGINNFANELNYLYYVNNLIYAGFYCDTSDYEELSKEEMDQECLHIMDCVDKFIDNMKQEYGNKYGEEALAKVNAVKKELPACFRRDYYNNNNGAYIYYKDTKSIAASYSSSDSDFGEKQVK